MARLGRDDVIESLGEVNDVTIAEIIATAATKNELAEAMAWLANDEPLINAGRPLPSGRVGQLIEIISDLDDDDTENTARAASYAE